MNKDREPMEIVIHNKNLATNTEEEIVIEDKEICYKLEDLLTNISIKTAISKIYLGIFWFTCVILLVGFYLYATRFEFILPIIILIGLLNTFNLSRYNNWIYLKEADQSEFSNIIDNYIKRRKVNEWKRII